MSAKSITFGKRMRKSYQVTLPDGFKFKNDRQPHVETSDTIAEGTVVPLGERRTLKMRGNHVVMYDVLGVMNGPNHTAHITVYFGPSEEESKLY